ncbi:MAG: 3-oxoacyl-ACP synthase III [Pseudomonadota bacterium]
MRYQNTCIEAVSYELPRAVVTTASIERALGGLYGRLGISSGTLQALTGVEARRFWEAEVTPSDAATLAAEKLFAEAGFPRERVQVLVSTSVCRDYLEPSVASLVHGNLRLGSHCANFDVGNACLGFMTGLTMVANMIELGQITAGLVVAGESSRQVTEATIARLQQPGLCFSDFRDNLATLTLGSAATAMLLVHRDLTRAGHRLLGGATGAATAFCRLCLGTETGMRTDPARLLAEGVKLAGHTWRQALAELDLTVADVREFAMHQVGKGNHDSIVRALGLPDERALRTYPDYGNVGAAGVPLTLARAVDLGRVAPGDRVALMGIGSGLNCQILGVAW